MHKSIAIGTLCGTAVLAGVVNADSISYSDLTPGKHVATGLLANDSATATAYGNYAKGTAGKFSTFSVLGQSPVAGVGGSLRIGDSLLGGSEAIVFDFAKAVFVDKLDIAFLYQGAQFLPQQGAKFTVTYEDDTTGSFILRPTSLTTASYPGAVASVNSGAYRTWDLTDPFGQGRAITQIVLEAGSGSSFGFKEMRVTPVPLPAALWGGLALMGAVGVTTARKRRLVA